MRRPVRIARPLALLLLFAALAVTGLAKLHAPAPAADFLVNLIAVRSVGLVRAVAAVEIALALWLISGLAPRTAALTVASVFTVFVIAHANAQALPEPPACGCGGSAPILESVPPIAWAGVSVAGAALGAALCATAPPARSEPQAPGEPSS